MRTLALGLLLAGCGADPADDSAPADTDADADADSDTDTDADADTDTDHPDPGTPAFEATFSGESWSAEDGYWFAPGSETILQGADSTNTYQLQVVLEGAVEGAGTFPVDSVAWTHSEHNDPVFDYQIASGQGSFVVEALDASGDYLWGHLEAPLGLADSYGENPDLTLDALVLTSWPATGAR